MIGIPGLAFARVLGDNSAVPAYNLLLSVLFFQEENHPNVWIAQVLEHDVVAYGADIAAATRALTMTLRGHVIMAERHHIEPFSTVKPAPDVFWTRWRDLIGSGKKPVLLLDPLPLTIPAFMVQAVSHEPVSTAH